jgi:hypothetical protein
MARAFTVSVSAFNLRFHFQHKYVIHGYRTSIPDLMILLGNVFAAYFIICLSLIVFDWLMTINIRSFKIKEAKWSPQVTDCHSIKSVPTILMKLLFCALRHFIVIFFVLSTITPRPPLPSSKSKSSHIMRYAVGPLSTGRLSGAPPETFLLEE